MEGDRFLAKAIADNNKAVKVDIGFNPTEILVKPPTYKPKKYRCCMCGTEYTNQTGNFPKSSKSRLWRGNNGYVPFCRSCANILLSDMSAYYSGNMEHAMKHICFLFDLEVIVGLILSSTDELSTNRSRAK